ncbi:MAG TPA: hypothetical protein VFC67_28455 [Prolixibacteraceae bacterium]|nr:hypothetical protein [Prolixibacteraceae bacterium]
MKQKTINQIGRATIAEYCIAAQPSPAKKYFVWLDLTFRREDAIKISGQHILEKFDLQAINQKNGQTLGNFLMTCNVGDVFKSKNDMLECLSIN